MRLADLDPQFLTYEEGKEGVLYRHVDTIEAAHGIRFLCPKCFAAAGSTKGTHSVICWSRKVPNHARPRPGRWALKGTGYADLTLDSDPPGGARSVLLTGGCGWHGFVTSGDAT